MTAGAIDRDAIDRLTEAGHLSAAARDAALVQTDIIPDATAWQQFLSRLFLLLGVLFLAAAVGYFIAYNWEVLGRFAKIGLIEAGLVVAVAVALCATGDGLAARAALLMAVLLTGPLLAYVGQTYQTGADTYELFRAWALLALPWVMVARWRPVWCLWLLLVNVSLALYVGQVWRPMAASLVDPVGALLHLSVNGLFLVVFEAWAGRYVSGSGRSVERFALAILLAAACGLWMVFLFDYRVRTFWQPLLAIVAFVAVWWVYRRQRLDVAALALWCLGGIVAAMCTMGKLLSEARAESLAFLLSGVTAIALSAWAAGWLRQLHRESLAGSPASAPAEEGA
ncbi:MAG: DUF2157 domain-containing protein [Betaproteobacteria bacterium]|nr:DUF2157 domain-containing protein [Betaproteobacteria bacterium]